MRAVQQVRLEHRSFKTPSNRVVELTTVASNYHIEMSPGDAGIYDRYVVQVRSALRWWRRGLTWFDHSVVRVMVLLCAGVDWCSLA